MSKAVFTKNDHLKMDKFEKQDHHLMMVMDTMINTLQGVQHTTPHSNTIRVIGHGVGGALQNLVDQVPVLGMKVYRVADRNLKGTDREGKEVHVVLFTFHRLQKAEMLGRRTNL